MATTKLRIIRYFYNTYTYTTDSIMWMSVFTQIILLDFLLL